MKDVYEMDDGIKVSYINEKLKLDIDYEEALQIKKRIEKIIFLRQENAAHYNSYALSEQLYSFIVDGDMDGFHYLVSQDFSCVPGTLAADGLRNTKNFMICICSNVVSHLLEHRYIDEQIGYSISAIAIQMIEEAKNEHMLHQIMAGTMYELIGQRNKFKIKRHHPLVRAVDTYIFEHMHEKIVISKMAEELGTSPSYLSQVFRKYQECTIQQYIMDERIGRGKNLLRFSDYSIQEISHYLGFSSQSKFGQEFKKREEITPGEYRKRYKDWSNKLK